MMRALVAHLHHEQDQAHQRGQQEEGHTDAFVGQCIVMDVVVITDEHGHHEHRVLGQPEVAEHFDRAVARVEVEVAPEVIEHKQGTE